MLKLKRPLAVILFTTMTASTVFLTSVSFAQPCELSTSFGELRTSVNEAELYEQGNWLQSPWIMILTLPGIALAATLSVGDRLYKKE